MKTISLRLILSVIIPSAGIVASHGAGVVRQVSGANAAAIQTMVDQFRTDLGGANNGVNGSFLTGRREINWDGVPDSFSVPNFLPANFFNVNSPRGVVFNGFESLTGAALNHFLVSSNTASGIPVRFGNIDASYSAAFTTFSAQRLFVARDNPLLEVNFFLPGTKIPATVHGFGVIFCDSDSATGGKRALIRCYGVDGTMISAASAPTAANGLSFVGISYNAGERVARVQIQAGNAGLGSGIADTSALEVMAMDDFIYGEPQPLEITSGDLAVTVAVPLKFTNITATGAPAGFMKLSLQCSPGHTYRFFSSTNLIDWHPSLVSGAVVGPDQNFFNPRAAGDYVPVTAIATALLSKENQAKLFYRVIDEKTGDVTIIGTP